MGINKNNLEGLEPPDSEIDPDCRPMIEFMSDDEREEHVAYVRMLENKELPERILEAAIWYQNEEYYPSVKNISRGTVVTGFRHHIIIQQLFKLYGKRTGENTVQGFVTSKNRFVDREEARKIALACGQIEDSGTHHPKELFSEDLY